ncbi:carboxypeptidase-like regulatory domain-containing protein [Pontibacter sp. FD36]|uniref:carboxypeptidase-like regulatory domain-containing protein n=1 Tax=Pontibacter sp. FD36 TaxID=2789860 RepID=UPI0018AAD2AE|nr:carboxypeptidase-like regulatory domain-containing protein [Pontibacter sp. FD36]MBF8965137.1 carboxypeptidase-like regulatory domain-containing protein [Pontibacter sp. FD36]
MLRQLPLLLLFLLLSIQAFAQGRLAKSQLRSPYTYIYRITDEQALKIYEKGPDVVKSSFFHTVVDSFAINKTYTKPLPQGHYLYMHAQGPDLVYWLETKSKLQAKLLHLQPELALLVHDSMGQLVTDAEVMAGKQRVPFDSKTNTYRLKKGPKKGILSVSHSGLTFYEELTPQHQYHYKPKWWQRLINTWPIYYTWRPFRDVYRTIRWGEPQGWIRRIASIFDEEYRLDKPEKYKGYLVTNKPLYQPGDTVRYKAYVVNQNGRPVQYKAQLMLNGYNIRRKKMGELAPYRKGAYEGWFVLHDSLNLRLDASYTLTLERTNKRGDELVRHSFTYEDYELKENKYTLRLAHEEHQAGVENQVHVRGTDANGLNLLDARVEVVVLTRQVFGSREQQVFVPDTLWKHSQALEAAGETSISIPATAFPKASLRYQVRADFLNSSNERSFQSAEASYTYLPGQLKLSLSQDSLLAQYLEGGKPMPHQAKLIAVDAKGNKVLEQQVQLPYRLPVNPYVRRYILQTPEQEETLALNPENALVQAYTDRSNDSLYFVLDNPRKLPYWYFVYRGDKLVYQGKGQERDFSYTRALRGDDPYFVTLRYMWGGEIRSDEKVAPHRKYTLNVEVEAPQVVYPGQQSDLTVTVRDAKGKPVPNTDLTAYAITSKFTAQGVPSLPSWDRYKGRKSYQKLRLNNEAKAATQLMDWNAWSRRMGLDSIAYYNFLYPKQGIFTEYSLSRDSLTQFSPFVVDSGRVVPVHVVYLDRVPVYFSGTDVVPAYSFAADSGYHTIVMRTADKLVTLDSVYLRPYHKLVLSADLTPGTVPYAKEAERKDYLSTRERNNLHGYLMQVEHNFGSDLAYLKQGRRVLRIEDNPARNNHYYSATKSVLAGPFSPGYLQFTRYNRFNTSFELEAGYTYTFERELLKMRERKLLPDHVHLGNWNKKERNPVPLYDKASTEQQLQQEWEELQHQFWLQKAFGNNPLYDDYLPKGRVGWRLDSAFTQMPAVAVLHKAGQPDSARLYSGSNILMTGIPIGKYRLALLFPDSSYVATDLQVQANGQVQLYLKPNAQQQADRYSQMLQQLIKRRIREAQRGVSIEVQQQVIRQMRNDSYTSGLHEYSTTVSGIVVDAGSGTPLPGVAVLVKGTRIGTATDANGYYQLGVPSNAVLVFRFIGYVTSEVATEGRRIVDASLSADMQQLSEVVVVGYGVQQKREMTYAAATATVVEGRAQGIRIRGNATIQSASSPLIIVNGVPYSGELSDLDPALIASMTKLSAEAGMALYGSVAAGGVIIIGGKGGPANLTAELPVDEAGAIRENFSDFAFWQPRLLTDRKGQASFPVTFPGDITSWNTYVLGMDGKKRTGIYSTSIKSFKAMMATLAMPRFLVEGDKTQVIGKALNYLPDSSSISTRFEVAGKPMRESQILLKRAHTDTLTLTAPSVASDSVEVLFALRSAEGMADGERRHIRVYPKGTEETIGHFLALHTDTTVTLNFDPVKGPVKLHAKGNLLEVMLEEIDYLHKYEYWCSEQAASKLKGLLLEKRIREQLGEKFTHERMVRRLVRHLEKTQLPEGAWTWWQSGPAYTWITSHVVEALSLAKAEGYAPKYDEQKLLDFMVYRLEQARFIDKLMMLETLHKLQAKVDYNRYVVELSKRDRLSLEEQLRLTRMRQLLKLEAPLDTLQKYKQVTTLGGLHWGENRYSLFNNHISNTLLAYDILKAAGGHEQDLASIRAFLLSERRNGRWRNTYESAHILETLLPDLLSKEEGSQPQLQNSLQLTGPLRLEATDFPLDTTFLPGQPLVISKTGKLPLYLTAYQTHWNASPEPVQKDFVVSTSFKGIASQATLKAGKPVELVVEVEAKADADYVLIEVPIPAGCSYDGKKGRGSYEVHREYFRNKVAIFADRLPKGKHTYTIQLLPRYNGTFTVNPAKAELMYFPVFYGRTGIKGVIIE